MVTADLADAAPETGIVWVYRFRPDGTAEVIPNTDVDAALSDQGAGWIWIHLALADMRCRNWIAQHAPVSELARDVLGGPDTHLRLDILGSEIVGVLPDLHQELARTRRGTGAAALCDDRAHADHRAAAAAAFGRQQPAGDRIPASAFPARCRFSTR